MVFFPPHHAERKNERLSRERRAKAICASCPVLEPCLDYALTIREPHGIWGGLNEMERRARLEDASATASWECTHHSGIRPSERDAVRTH